MSIKYYSVVATVVETANPSLDHKIVRVSYDRTTNLYSVDVLHNGFGISGFDNANSHEEFLIKFLESHSYKNVQLLEATYNDYMEQDMTYRQGIYREHTNRLASVSDFHKNYRATS